jgi:hypothetical protein
MLLHRFITHATLQDMRLTRLNPCTSVGRGKSRRAKSREQRTGPPAASRQGPPEPNVKCSIGVNGKRAGAGRVESTQRQEYTLPITTIDADVSWQHGNDLLGCDD